MNEALTAVQERPFDPENDTVPIFDSHERSHRRQEMLKLLEENQKPVWKSLGAGIHDGVFYYGWKACKSGMLLDSVITSEQDIFLNEGKEKNDIRDLFGLSHRLEFYEDNLDHGWS